MVAAKVVVGYSAIALYGMWPWKRKTYDVDALEDEETARAYQAYQTSTPPPAKQYQPPPQPSPPRVQEERTGDITSSMYV